MRIGIITQTIFLDSRNVGRLFHWSEGISGKYQYCQNDGICRFVCIRTPPSLHRALRALFSAQNRPTEQHAHEYRCCHISNFALACGLRAIPAAHIPNGPTGLGAMAGVVADDFRSCYCRGDCKAVDGEDMGIKVCRVEQNVLHDASGFRNQVVCLPNEHNDFLAGIFWEVVALKKPKYIKIAPNSSLV